MVNGGGARNPQRTKAAGKPKKLRGQRPVNLKNFLLSPPERQRTQPFYTTRRRQAALTCAVRRAPFSKTAAKGGHHNPQPEKLSNLRTLRP